MGHGLIIDIWRLARIQLDKIANEQVSAQQQAAKKLEATATK
jgi:hypothetical protein